MRFNVRQYQGRYDETIKTGMKVRVLAPGKTRVAIWKYGIVTGINSEDDKPYEVSLTGKYGIVEPITYLYRADEMYHARQRGKRIAS